jgi:wyosine [tRNA(Phe)-imidazoG37] synthetase (radical SAM superfamily)
MKIQTLSIISGGAACNARCPFCISQMTGKDVSFTPINIINFNKACRLAQINDVTNVIITGKGEPILYPNQITDFLKALKPFNFPIIELQTNAIRFSEQPEKFETYLKEWHKLGLTFIAISIVHYDPEKNRKNYIPYQKSYPDLEKLIIHLHGLGYSVRLTCTLVKGGIDSAAEAKEMIKIAGKWKAEQLTLRKVAAPRKSQNAVVYSWTKAHELSKKDLKGIEEYLSENGTKIASFDYGGAIYDVDGQNVCFTNALTLNNNTESFRQAIYFPDGHIRFDWQYQGAIII